MSYQRDSSILRAVFPQEFHFSLNRGLFWILNHSPFWNTDSFGLRWFLSWYRGIDCWPLPPWGWSAGFNLTTRDSYSTKVEVFSNFSRKDIFHESFRVNKTQDYGLETYQQVQNYSTIIILKTFLSAISVIIQFFTEQKFCKHHYFGAKNSKMIRRDNWPFKHLFALWFTVVSIKLFRIIMQHKEIWFIMLFGLCKPRWRWQW